MLSKRKLRCLHTRGHGFNSQTRHRMFIFAHLPSVVKIGSEFTEKKIKNTSVKQRPERSSLLTDRYKTQPW